MKKLNKSWFSVFFSYVIWVSVFFFFGIVIVFILVLVFAQSTPGAMFRYVGF